VDPHQATRQAKLCLLLATSLSLLAGINAVALAQPKEADVAILPDDVARFWPWFPAGTETMIIARDVDMKSPFGVAQDVNNDLSTDERRTLVREGFVTLTKQTALGVLPVIGGGRMAEPGPYNKHLRDVRASLIVYGGRDYTPVSAFGLLRYHGASVVVFSDDAVADIDRWMAALEKDALEVRRVDDKDVLLFPPHSPKLEAPSQGIFVVRLAPDTVLCATSDIYLNEMLTRMDRAPGDRALPGDLPEWSYVDTTASLWALRHIPPVDGQKLTGLVWLMQPGGRPEFKLHYLPHSGQVDPIPREWHESWFKQHEKAPGLTEEDLKERIDISPDGVAHVTVPLGDIGRTVGLPLFQIGPLQGIPGAW
jgi:hypothetical protein